MSWNWLGVIAVGWLAAGSPVWAQAPAADAVMLVDAPDVSGSMVKAVASMAEAEVEQLKRTLRPGDVYARVPFDSEARLSVLQHVRSEEDIANIGAIVLARAVAGGRTSLSKGLIAAREVVDRAAGDRRVVLVLASDGVNQPADGKAAEDHRFAAIAAWWKARPATDRVVVGIVRRGNRRKLEALAASLQARLVTLEEYKSNTLIERAIAGARAAAVPQPEPSPPVPPAPVTEQTRWWPWMLAALPCVALGWVALRTTKADERQVPPGLPAVVRVPVASAMELFVSVSANGNAHHTVLPVDEIEFGTVTLGMAGTVAVPGLSGAPVTVFVTCDAIELTEQPGTGVRVNGEALGLMPEPVNVGRECRLTHRGVAVNLQLRRMGERRAVHPIRVVANGGRR